MVLRSRCTAALLLPGRAAAKYAIPQPAPIAQLDRASDYESEGRVFESPWAHSGSARVSLLARLLRPSAQSPLTTVGDGSEPVVTRSYGNNLATGYGGGDGAYRHRAAGPPC